MDMRMMGEGLAPGVQDGEEPDLGAEMRGIGGERHQRFGCRAHQDRINGGLVLESDLRGGWWQREDHVEIEELALPSGEPALPRLALALRAVPIAARIIGDADRAAGSTSPSSSEARLRTRNESREARAKRIVIMPTTVWRWRKNL